MTEEPGDKLLRYLESKGYFLSDPEREQFLAVVGLTQSQPKPPVQYEDPRDARFYVWTIHAAILLFIAAITWVEWPDDLDISGEVSTIADSWDEVEDVARYRDDKVHFVVLWVPDESKRDEVKKRAEDLLWSVRKDTVKIEMAKWPFPG
jgi:hypothetical protein